MYSAIICVSRAHYDDLRSLSVFENVMVQFARHRPRSDRDPQE